MTFYWSFALDAVAERVLYLKDIQDTETYEQVTFAIQAFRGNLPDKKTWEEISI